MKSFFGLGVIGTMVAIIAAVVCFGITRERKVGSFLGVPYDWRRPTVAVLQERWWNPADPRIFTPKVFGWGWSINLGRIWLLLQGKTQSETP